MNHCGCTKFCFGNPGVTPGCMLNKLPPKKVAACGYCGQRMSEPEDINVGGHEQCRLAEATWHLQHWEKE